MTRSEAVKFIIIRSIGNFLVLFSLFGVLATFGPVLYYEVQFRVVQARGIHFVVGHQPTSATQQKNTTAVPQEETTPGFAQILEGDKEQILLPKDTQFSIVIPKIGASAKISPNVDPGNQEAFLPILQKGIAHAQGSVFPGMQGNIYLFAHSTDNWWNVGRYNAVFYLLRDLTLGDEIIVFFEERRYEYVVSQTIIADPNDVSFLAQPHTGKEKLVLQTCWPPGTTWKRLYIIAVPKD